MQFPFITKLTSSESSLSLLIHFLELICDIVATKGYLKLRSDVFDILLEGFLPSIDIILLHRLDKKLAVIREEEERTRATHTLSRFLDGFNCLRVSGIQSCSYLVHVNTILMPKECEDFRSILFECDSSIDDRDFIGFSSWSNIGILRTKLVIHMCLHLNIISLDRIDVLIVEWFEFVNAQLFCVPLRFSIDLFEDGEQKLGCFLLGHDCYTSSSIGIGISFDTEPSINLFLDFLVVKGLGETEAK